MHHFGDSDRAELFPELENRDLLARIIVFTAAVRDMNKWRISVHHYFMQSPSAELIDHLLNKEKYQMI
jgi:hypothetical protein